MTSVQLYAPAKGTARSCPPSVRCRDGAVTRKGCNMQPAAIASGRGLRAPAAPSAIGPGSAAACLALAHGLPRAFVSTRCALGVLPEACLVP
eukprot:2555745-Prymnesium_polylepis.1